MVNETFPGYALLKTRLTRLAVFASVALFPAVSALACDTLRTGPTGRVVSVVDGDTVRLDSGLVVRMVGTQAPKLPLGRDGFETWPMAEEARRALEALVLNKEVRLGYGGESVDRYARALGHIFLNASGGEGVWAQEFMVAEGLARVYSFPDNRHCLSELYAAEAEARANRLGIWADPYYQIRAADRPFELLERVGHYELVEGRVLLADQSGSRVYLNFGRYWKEDFTIVIERPALRLFAEAGLDPLALEGTLVRVRGWVDDLDGPRIEVTHPEQIEVLGGR